MSEYYKLFYSHPQFTFINGVTISSEHSGCPACGFNYSLNKTFKNMEKMKAVEFNELVTFTCSNCDVSINLQIGIHKDSLIQKICIQRGDLGDLPDDWWVEEPYP